MEQGYRTLTRIAKYFHNTVVWSLALRSDDAKQDPVVYSTKFGVVFLAEGPRTASIQKGFDCFGLYHPSLDRERDFRLAIELP